MFLVIQKMTGKKEDLDKFAEALGNRTALKEQDGFVDLTVLRNTDDGKEMTVIGRWKSEDAWAAWESTDTREEVKVDIEFDSFESGKYKIEQYLEK
jgi:heme-degrading monooxygenase HmoA